MRASKRSPNNPNNVNPTPPKKPSSLRIIPIMIIVAMLAFSVRLVDFALGVSSLNGAAVAQETPAKDEAITLAQAEPAASDETPETPVEEASVEEEDSLPPPDTDQEWRDSAYEDLELSNISREVFDDLVARRKKLEQREREVQTREALLRAAEQEVDRKVEELSNLRAQIEGLLEQQSAEEAARTESLVKIYENMKPKDAARIFDTLDLDVLVSVMSRMSERKLSPVLAAMNPERARTITIMLAEEKQLPSLPGN